MLVLSHRERGTRRRRAERYPPTRAGREQPSRSDRRPERVRRPPPDAVCRVRRPEWARGPGV